MIYIIIGTTNSGKSSITKNTFIRGRQCVTTRDLMPITEFDDCVLIGRYDTGVRRVGTDTIERKMVGVLVEQVQNLLNKGKNVIVMEGMRCISRPMMNKLLQFGQDIYLIWVQCSPEKSWERTEHSIKFKTCKGDWTKCNNFINDYKDKVRTKIINTESLNGLDFTKLKLED